MATARFHVLADLIAAHRWTAGVELGVYKGETLFHLVTHFPALTMIGVDTWLADPGPTQDRRTGETSYAAKPMDAIEAEVWRMAEFFGKRITILKKPTAEAANFFHDGAFDFVFVDADHRTAAVIADCQAWLPKIRSGGMLLGHDENWPAVRAALAHLFGTWQTLPANVWAWPVP